MTHFALMTEATLDDLAILEDNIKSFFDSKIQTLQSTDSESILALIADSQPNKQIKTSDSPAPVVSLHGSNSSGTSTSG